MTDKELIRDRSRAARAPRPVTIARHGRLRRSGPWRTVLGLIGGALAVTLVSGTAVAGIAAAQLKGDLDANAVDINETEVPIPNIGAFEGGFNILIVGNDDWVDRDAVLNDVNILVHVAADHSSATAVSIPRDLVVPFPSCTNEETGRKSSPASGLPLNTALSYGGLPCVVDVIQNLTGLDVHFAGMIGFQGVINMSDAIGGVEVCVDKAINDKKSGLFIPAGTSTLQGWDALAFLRTRHGVGDGSDLTRISSQQVFLSSLVRKLKAEDTLTNVTKLYGLAKAATQNMTLSRELTQIPTMIALAKALANIPMERITFVQYPGTTGHPGIYENKVKPNTVLANKLFDAIRADVAIGLEQAGDGRGSTVDPNAPIEEPTTEPDPTQTGEPGTETNAPAQPEPSVEVIGGLRGQTAADRTCSVAN